MKIKILWVLVMAFLILPGAGCGGPEVGGYEAGEIDVSGEPEQAAINEDQSFVIENSEGTFNVKPLADYRIAAKVAGTESYSRGWTASLAPVDLALVWGDLALPEFEQHITYSQGGRWYRYKYGPGFPGSNRFIIEHSSNNHIIPATDNLREALETVAEGDRVVIEGCLVKIRGNTKNGKCSWNTSLRRSDTGDHSCELIYAEKLRVNDRVYR